MSDIRRRLGNRIYQERKRRSLTQAALAEKVELSEFTISLVERGLRAPSLPTLEKLAGALKVEVKELFDHPDGGPEPEKEPLELTRLVALLEGRPEEELRWVYRVLREMLRNRAKTRPG